MFALSTTRRRLIHVGIMTIALIPGLVAVAGCDEDSEDVAEEIGDVGEDIQNTAEDVVDGEGTSEPTETPEDAEEATEQQGG